MGLGHGLGHLGGGAAGGGKVDSLPLPGEYLQLGKEHIQLVHRAVVSDAGSSAVAALPGIPRPAVQEVGLRPVFCQFQQNLSALAVTE